MDLEEDGFDDEGEVVFGGYGDTCDTSSPTENEAANIDLPGRTDAAAVAGAFPSVAVTYPPVTTDEVRGHATETAVKSDESPSATTDDDNHPEGVNDSDATSKTPAKTLVTPMISTTWTTMLEDLEVCHP